MIVMTQEARTAGFVISLVDVVILWSKSSRLQVAHCGQSEAKALSAVHDTIGHKCGDGTNKFYQSWLKHTVKVGKHPTVSMPQVTKKNLFLINQPTKQFVREQAGPMTSDKNLILCLSRSPDLASGTSWASAACGLSAANWGCYGDLFC